MSSRTLALIQIDKKSMVLGGIFVVLNLLDGFLTRILLADWGMEGNPLWPYGGNILAKGLLSLVIAALLVRFRFRTGLWIACGAMVAVVIWNGFLLLFMQNTSISIIPIDYP